MEVSELLLLNYPNQVDQLSLTQHIPSIFSVLGTAKRQNAMLVADSHHMSP
jgi:hypothetical protein